ncbi:site-specific DNA-methyltransferase [Campylobacter sp. RM12637]|uniref:site-specific DNA-methyltransferase n=1 Tax=Campylobacter sp. RM12637 TaxID=2735734 RepID=UPI0030157CF1|nr:site-specific DNA-methyltransferase [Campylobacter sp. RM12637]
MNNKIFIGDNLKVLNSKYFQNFKNNIQFIYIDPPYNTNTIKTYNDNYIDWTEHIVPRLKLSKELLNDTGIICISIDDYEYANLKLECDKIFGKKNYIGTFITNQAMRSNAKFINIIHEYILMYAKDKSKAKLHKILRVEIPEQNVYIQFLIKEIKNIFIKDGQEEASKELKNLIKNIAAKDNMNWVKNYSNVDEDGNIYFAKDLSTPSNPRKVNIQKIGLFLNPLKTRGWVSDEKFISLYNENKLVYKNNRPYAKHYIDEATDNIVSKLNFYSRQGSNDLNNLGLRDVFENPKAVSMIKMLIDITTNTNDIVLDFYAGSGTTAQAVYELNKQKNKNIYYILVQNKEKVNEKSKSYKICKKLKIYPSIDNILFYRIKKYLEKNKLQIDYERIDYE